MVAYSVNCVANKKLSGKHPDKSRLVFHAACLASLEFLRPCGNRRRAEYSVPFKQRTVTVAPRQSPAPWLEKAPAIGQPDRAASDGEGLKPEQQPRTPASAPSFSQ
jgi:hypothetical protein